MADSRIGKKLKAFCANCKGERNCEIKGHHREYESDPNIDWWRNWYLLVCCGCDHVFAQSVASDSESIYPTGYDHEGNIEYEQDERIESWPAKFKRDRPDWFSSTGVETDHDGISPLDQSLFELYGALDNDLNMLAAIGLRSSFDIASEILGVDADLPFQSKLGGLVAKKLIKEHEREHLDVLVDAGSASAHRGWKPSVDDLDALMGILEAFIYDCFVVPTRNRLAAERVAKVKAKVPPKPVAGKSRKSKAST